MKKIILILISFICLCGFSVCLTACSKNQSDNILPKDEETQTCEHYWDEWVVSKIPTCTETGKKIHMCFKCNYSESQEISALGHIEITDTALSPTCTESGLTEGKHCDRCNKVLIEQKQVPALGHCEIIDKAINPTCRLFGFTEGKHCLECGYVTIPQKKLQIIEHNYQNGVCSMCKKKLNEELDYELIDNSYVVTGVGNCKNSIVVPNGYNGLPVIGIKANAFKGCDSLTSIVLNKSITYIGAEAFRSCYNLKSISFSNSMMSIGTNAFYFTNINDVFYNGTIDEWLNISFTMYSNPCFGGANLYINNQLLTNLVIPNYVKCISPFAFTGCKSITKLIFGDSLWSIDSHAFANCTNLKHIEFSKSLTFIGTSAFSGCKALNEIILPNSIKSLSRGAFENCADLSKIFIPISVLYIDYDVFISCPNLTIYCEATSKPNNWNSNWNRDNCMVIWGKIYNI